mgnify:CR=1 FL=1
MQQSRPRKPRFTRVAGSARISLTARDLRILSEVARHRFTQSHHLARLLGGSVQHVVRRLGKLYHAGLLDRPRAQLLLRESIAPSLLYCLSPDGRKVLETRQSEAIPPIPRLRGAACALSLSHALRVTDILVAIQHAAAQGRTAFLSLPSQAGSMLAEGTSQEWRMRWRVRQERGQAAWIIPDGAFALQSEEGTPTFFMLEADRGTMPVARSKPGQSSFERKIRLYKETRGQGALWSRFGIPAFRVLIVAESRQRLATIQRATARQFKRGDSEMFLFAVASDVMSGNSIDAWMTCGGAGRCLLPHPEGVVHSADRNETPA